MEKVSCQHLEFEAFVDVNRLEDLVPMGFMADIRIRCKDCERPFHFVGVPDFGLDFTKPTLNVDSTELHCPLAPGPAQWLPTSMRYTAPPS